MENFEKGEKKNAKKITREILTSEEWNQMYDNPDIVASEMSIEQQYAVELHSEDVVKEKKSTSREEMSSWT